MWHRETAAVLLPCGMASLLCVVISVGWADEPGGNASLDLRSRPAGQKLMVRTQHRIYRAQLLDPESGKCEVAVAREGQPFSTPRTVYVLGATSGWRPAGGMLTRMGEIRIGWPMELGLDSLDAAARATTAPVVAFELLGP